MPCNNVFQEHVYDICARTLQIQLTLSAATSFTLQPAKQLQDTNPSTEAVLICRSYGGLLWAVNLLCLQFLLQRGDTCDDIAGMLTVSLAVYHIFPIFRAANRIAARSSHHHQQPQNHALGGPALHLFAHSVLFCSLIWSWGHCHAVKS